MLQQAASSVCCRAGWLGCYSTMYTTILTYLSYNISTVILTVMWLLKLFTETRQTERLVEEHPCNYRLSLTHLATDDFTASEIRVR